MSNISTLWLNFSIGLDERIRQAETVKSLWDTCRRQGSINEIDKSDPILAGFQLKHMHNEHSNGLF